jgi:hypothetical protein
MLPNTKIRIKKNGDLDIEGMEQSDTCSRLKEMAKMAGKVVSEKDKDHTPVHQTVTQKQGE